ncbi:MAG: NmrA/HSCARG family protein [Polyangiaceae bacterium]|nr:NmrA/HSCARG family protein [Polyangiaceae bacterium]
MSEARIAVCGATGNQGRAVVRSLLASGRWEVVALTRSPEGEAARDLARAGARLVRADLLDRASLVGAFRGARGVFGVTQPWSPDYKHCDVRGEVRQGKNIVDACVEAGVEHLVLSTVLQLGDQKKTNVPHVDSKLEVESHARAQPVPLTVLRPASFMDNIGSAFFPVRRGRVRGFVDADAKVPYIACSDIGALAAVALSAPSDLVGKTVNAVGDLASGEDLVAALGKLRGGERFRYTAPPAFLMRLFAREFFTMRRAFEKYGRPPYPGLYADAMAETLRWVPDVTTLEKFLEREGYASKALG